MRPRLEGKQKVPEKPRSESRDVTRFDIMSLFGYATQHPRLATAAAVGTMALAIKMLSESSVLSSVACAVGTYALSIKGMDLHSHRIFTRPVVYAKYAAAPEPAPAAPRK